MKKILLGERVLIKKRTQEVKTKNGLTLNPGSSVNSYFHGEIFQIGDLSESKGKKVKSLEIGDNVLYQNGGSIQVGEEKLELVSIDNILYIF